MLTLTQPGVPALPAIGAQGSGAYQFFALMLFHMGSSVCPQHMSSPCLQLRVSPAWAGPQLTSARCTALHGTSAGMSRLDRHNRHCAPLHMQEQQLQLIDSGVAIPHPAWKLQR